MCGLRTLTCLLVTGEGVAVGGGGVMFFFFQLKESLERLNGAQRNVVFLLLSLQYTDV